MTATQIITLLIIVWGLWIILDSGGEVRRARFKSDIKHAEDFIMQADRNSEQEGLVANVLIKSLQLQTTSKTSQRRLNGLVVLWKSKFEHLFK